jgi:hypothetical protein
MLGSVQRGTTRPRIQPDWLNLLGAWKHYIGSHKRTAGIRTSIKRSNKTENLLIIKLLFIIHSKGKKGRETNPTYSIQYIIYSHKGLLIYKINQTVLKVSIITYKGTTTKKFSNIKCSIKTHTPNLCTHIWQWNYIQKYFQTAIFINVRKTVYILEF